jgi:hypothetical protein
MTRLEAGQPRLDSQQGQEIISLPRPDRLSIPTILLSSCFPPGVRRTGREDNNLPPSSAMIKKEWSYVPTPFHGTVLNKYQEQHYLHLLHFSIETRKSHPVSQ